MRRSNDPVAAKEFIAASERTPLSTTAKGSQPLATHSEQEKAKLGPLSYTVPKRKYTSEESSVDFSGRTTTPPSFQPPLREDIATVVFPGFLAAYGQASKYTGPDAVTVLDKRDRTKVVAKVTCEFSPRVLHNVVPAPDIRENELGWRFLNPISFFSCLKTWGTRLYFRMPALPMMHTVARDNNLGGYEDQKDCLARIEEAIAQLDAAEEKERKEKAASGERAAGHEEGQEEGDEVVVSKKKIVLFGFSRGAATIMHTALKLPKHIADRIALVVCEAPFDTFEGVMRDSSWFLSVNRALFKLVGNYSGEEAYAFPAETHLRCPIAFITSEADSRVVPKTTQRCIDTILSKYSDTIPSVEHLSLRYCRHPLMPYGHGVDREAYVAFMEALYARYLDGDEAVESTEVMLERIRKLQQQGNAEPHANAPQLSVL